VLLWLAGSRPERRAVQEFDYIVVGAGSAGCVLAARLSAPPDVRVLVLEAGSPARSRAMTVPNAWPENFGSAADWGEDTAPQADAGPVRYPRGRALGGSGAINAMAHVRGHRAVYDSWAAAGAAGWGFADLLPSFRRSERADGRDPALRGTSGPVRVAPAAAPHPAARAFVAALTAAGHPVTDDLSGARQEGVSWVDLAIHDGERVSPADAYLRPSLGRPSLTVATGCLVTGLQLEGDRCTGVRYLRDGQPAVARAAREFILAAGAVASPQLLMLSGIGPARQLRDLGIEVAADLAGVGANLQDHPVVYTSHAAPAPLPASAYNNGEAYAALRSDLAGQWPDLHLFPILLPIAPAGAEPPAAGFVLVAGVMAPDSRGSVTLASADPGAAPRIDPGFLRDGRDLDRLEAAAAIARDAAAASAFAACRRAEVWPGAGVRTRDGLRAWIRHSVTSYYHPAGTCRMGTDPAAVVDPQLRVRGISGLRVADASVMPVIPNAPPHATVLAIGERAAELIAG
jgi:choline dehydrogenase